MRPQGSNVEELKLTFTCFLLGVSLWQEVATANEQVWLSTDDCFSGDSRANQRLEFGSKNKEWKYERKSGGDRVMKPHPYEQKTARINALVAIDPLPPVLGTSARASLSSFLTRLFCCEAFRRQRSEVKL